MNNRIISCPSCGKAINGEKFRYTDKNNIPWYKFMPMKFYCPYCDVPLKYGAKSQIFMYLIAIVFLACVVLAIFEVIPFILTPIVIIILSAFFWRIRSLEIDKSAL